MSSFINNYYYGKAGKADFTEDDMPTNRFQLFFTTLRLHLSGLVGMNLLYVLFALPALAWTMINFSVMINTLESPEADATLSYMTVYVMGMIPCMALVGVGLSGIAYILRNWSRDQHTFTMSDLKDSIKTNWKLGLLEGLWTGVAMCAAWISYVFYGRMAAMRSVFFTIPQVLVLTICALFIMSTMLAYPMLVTYDLKFRHVVRNSILLTLKRLPLSLAVFVPSIAIPLAILLLFGGTQYGMLILFLLYLLFGFAFTEFVYVSYANACFDKYLNPMIEGAPVNMGMRAKTDDDDDEEEEEGNKEEAPKA